MCPKQCLGITKKGARCLIKVSKGEFCHYHVPRHQHTATRPGSRPNIFQSAQVPRKSANTSSLPATPKKDYATQPGYIYVYTLASFLSKHAKGGWVQTRNFSSDKRHKDKWVDVDMRRLETLLVKVGMTTKTPAIRILQWEAKCNHELQCLYPGSHPHLGKSSLLRMFGNLSIKSKPETKNLHAYVAHHHGFFVPQNVLHCEQLIHLILKLKYGRGEIHCTGCHEKSTDVEVKQSRFWNIFRSKEEAMARTDYNIHNEWFPVPRKSLDDVFSIISSECMKYKP
ncbi:DUF1766-domain-containing protein [Metschnikowia bicuspidata var. bicuspidata NRRL YB-4993]|uniref:DUF1766-domain-containing protein n=1 Tax=Metschnikowia bicuspidata var. bicuspidata NRRL YB-4993 TaxID=869754 RepID=A0A1A0HE81_9ASCO|nr:DUF1766-domain-containing protein [Metschnikowia bicuspidata var. bicuspidata NRRL YB-4993]OBA22301.1 DUF1766-domain-containing protein [Metschnikowia bicuspidata var. bicuspidata NRRL YB-4993]